MSSRHKLIVVVFGFLLCGLGCNREDSPPRQLTGVQVADRAKPATVWILTEIEATAQVPELRIDTDALRSVAQNRIDRNSSASARLRSVMNVLLSDPQRFLAPSSHIRTEKTTIRSQGSGLIFTPDGYIATNAHVVEPDPSDLKDALVSSVKSWVDSDVSDLQQAIQRVLPQATMTDEAKDRLMQALQNYYTTAGKLSDVSRRVSAVMGYTGSARDLKLVGATCEVKKIGKPIPGKDVAILKIDGEDMPTLPIAASLSAADLRTGAEIHVIGFPGGITFSSDLSMPSRLEPTQTTGHVSAIKQMEGGSEGDWPVVQTDTAINPGNSGGPALDDQGEVIGLATFKLRGQEGINFIIGADVLQEFIRGLNLKPATSQFTRKYLQALDAYDHNRRTQALALFRELHAEHAGIRPVEDFLQQLDNSGALAAPEIVRAPASSTREHSASVPAPSLRSGPLAVFALVVGIVAVVVVVVILKNR